MGGISHRDACHGLVAAEAVAALDLHEAPIGCVDFFLRAEFGREQINDLGATDRPVLYFSAPQARNTKLSEKPTKHAARQLFHNVKFQARTTLGLE